MYESLHVTVKMYINYSFFTFIIRSVQWKLATYWRFYVLSVSIFVNNNYECPAISLRDFLTKQHLLFKKYIWRPLSLVYDCRNAQHRSLQNNSQSAADDYLTPNQTGRDERPQYDVIQLGHTQRGPDAAGHYDSLNPQTRAEQPQYDVISRPQTH